MCVFVVRVLVAAGDVCGVCVQLVVAHNIAKCIGFPYGLLAVTEKPDASAPRDKTR